MNREHDEVTYSLLGSSTLLNTGWSTRYCIITVCSSTLLNTGWSTRYCIITVSGCLFYFGSSWQINLTMIVADIKEFWSAGIWCRVKRGKFNRWGILECMTLSLNYNTRQVNTELYFTPLRQDLRLHCILDFGCKSSVHSCTSKHRCQKLTCLKHYVTIALFMAELWHRWSQLASHSQTFYIHLQFVITCITLPISDTVAGDVTEQELYHVLFHSATLCDLVSGPPLLWGRENKVGPETVHNPTLTVTHQEVAQVYSHTVLESAQCWRDPSQYLYRELV